MGNKLYKMTTTIAAQYFIGSKQGETRAAAQFLLDPAGTAATRMKTTAPDHEAQVSGASQVENGGHERSYVYEAM